MRSGVRLALPAAGGVALLLGVSTAGAQAWIFDPRVEVQGVYNDNNRMTAERGQEIEVKGAAVDALVAFRKETQINEFEVALVGAQFKPDDNSPDTSTGGLVAEWRMAPTQIMNYYFRVGGNRAQQDATATLEKHTTSSFNGGAGVAWNYQLTRVMIDLLRSTSPSSQGAIVNRDEVRFSLQRDFSPLITGFLGLRGIRTQGLEGTGVNEVRERKYYTGRTGFEWHLNRAYSIEGAYEYRWQKYTGDPTDASSNGVTLSLVYQPRRLLK